MDSLTYRFADFSLDPAVRELRQHRRLLAVPPRIFDAITYLVEHRDRAVGRDELISALWGRVDVADRQVAQLIMRARHVLGQDGEAEPQAIRTIYGFGYRWVWEVTVGSPSAADSASVRAAGLVTEAPGKPRGAIALRGMAWLAVLALVLSVTGATLRADGRRAVLPPPRDFAARQTATVLPIETSAMQSPDAAWIRLGIMDLVAERLRRSGLSVPPSDGVVSALKGMDGFSAEDRLTAVERTIAADFMIDGKAVLASDGWTVELIARKRASGEERRAEARAQDVVPAANRATDALLAELGFAVAHGDDRGDALSEVLQRARAYILAQEIDAARELLMHAPASMRDSPELRLELAMANYYSGRSDEAERIATPLSEDPAVATDPRLHARVLMTRGTIARAGDTDWPAAEKWFDAAVNVLDPSAWTPELGEALAVRGIARAKTHDFAAAALDLGRARSLFEASGNRLGIGRVEDYLGRLEVERGRLMESLPHFRAAIEINESFGQVRRLTANLSALLDVQIQQLAWNDALATSERLRAMDDRITNPAWRHAIGSERAFVLIALGRHAEAESLLDELGRDDPSLTNICEERARVRLAWQRGRLDETRTTADALLKRFRSRRLEPSLSDIGLLLQRASMIDTVGEQIGLSPEDAAADPAYLVARAERSSRGGNEEAADGLFQEALRAADKRGLPGDIVLAADAYGRWLIRQGRIPDASAVAGRVAAWAADDYDSALLQVAVFHAAGQRPAWAAALRQAQKLAGERRIDASLREAPGAVLASAAQVQN